MLTFISVFAISGYFCTDKTTVSGERWQLCQIRYR